MGLSLSLPGLLLLVSGGADEGEGGAHRHGPGCCFLSHLSHNELQCQMRLIITLIPN